MSRLVSARSSVSLTSCARVDLGLQRGHLLQRHRLGEGLLVLVVAGGLRDLVHGLVDALLVLGGFLLRRLLGTQLHLHGLVLVVARRLERLLHVVGDVRRRPLLLALGPLDGLAQLLLARAGDVGQLVRHPQGAACPLPIGERLDGAGGRGLPDGVGSWSKLCASRYRSTRPARSSQSARSIGSTGTGPSRSIAHSGCSSATRWPSRSTRWSISLGPLAHEPAQVAVEVRSAGGVGVHGLQLRLALGGLPRATSWSCPACSTSTTWSW
jgi:hypothetical protein